MLAVAVLGLAASAEAVVVDGNPADYEMSWPELDGVGYLRGASGSVIAPNYVLTAGHVVGSEQTGSFCLDGESYAFDWSVRHPTADLAVVHLAEAVASAGYGLYRGQEETGQVAMLAGYGVSGDMCPQPAEYPRGTRRAGMNTVMGAVGGSLMFQFDPGTVCPAAGDSGGPSLLWDGEQWLLAGVHMSVTDFDRDGISPEAGDRAYDVRVSEYADWILSIMDRPSIGGDANLDRVVDGEDLAIFRANFGATGVGWQGGDFNLDGRVGLGDLGILSSNFGWSSSLRSNSQSSAPLVSVPEPHSAALVLLAALGRRRRRRR